MPWFNVDDGFANSRPVLRIPRRYRCAAIGLWTLAGSWSAKELTDGAIPDHAIEEFASSPAMAEQLVRAGLWRKVEGGWQFENWAKYQKTKEQVYAFRAAEAERKRKQRSGGKPPGGGGLSHRDSDRTDTAVPPGRDPESGLPIPIPTPSPLPILSSVETSGGGVTQVDAREPSPRCSKHLNHTDPPPCGRCASAREAHEAWAADDLRRRREVKTAAAQRRRDCPYCDEWGHVEVLDSNGNEAVQDCNVCGQEAVNS